MGDRRRAVLVTGASTGIGRNITEHLAADGHYVFGCARRREDLRALGRIDGVHPLRLDVTSSQDISEALREVTKTGLGLHGLVNNAGVGSLGPIINGDDREFNLLMTVNLYGPYRVTKAFAPLIIAGRGRIVTIGSVSGILAAENAGAYSMSKHAVEAFTDSLAEELAGVGVQVSVVEPGKFKTQIGRAASKRAAGSTEPLDLSMCREPDAVSEAVVLALFERSAKRRYLVVASEDEAHRTIAKHIERLAQLNEGHPYTYERDTLIRMLDNALRLSRPRTETIVGELGAPADSRAQSSTS